MSSRANSRQLCLITLLLASAGTPLVPAPLPSASLATKATAKRPLTHDVYDSWRSIQGTKLSRDGNWLVYALTPQDGDGELVARNLKTGKEWRAPRGKDPVLSADGKFVAFAVAPTKAELDKAKKDKKKPEEMPKPGMGVLDLATGKAETLERVKAFRLGEEGGRFVAVLLEPDKKDDKKAAEKIDGQGQDEV